MRVSIEVKSKAPAKGSSRGEQLAHAAVTPTPSKPKAQGITRFSVFLVVMLCYHASNLMIQ
jgi:hypothetical protein